MYLEAAKKVAQKTANRLNTPVYILNLHYLKNIDRAPQSSNQFFTRRTPPPAPLADVYTIVPDPLNERC
jgi:hypothetical protein